MSAADKDTASIDGEGKGSDVSSPRKVKEVSMSNYNARAVMSPPIPISLLKEEDIETLKDCGFDKVSRKIVSATGGGEGWYYFFAYDYDPDSEEAGGKNIFSILQEIVRRSEGKIPYICISIAITNDNWTEVGYGGAEY
jgi:hypothetical protein